jgi:hypothetical protein
LAPQVFSKTKDEMDKALTKLETGIEHLGKLTNSPDKDPRGKWKGTIKKVADAIDQHADRMTGHQKMANNLHEAADWLRSKID